MPRFIKAKFLVKKYELNKKGAVKGIDTFSVDFSLNVLPKYFAKLAWEEVIQVSAPSDTLSFDLAYAVPESSTEHPHAWTKEWDSPEKSKIYRVDFIRDPATQRNLGCVGSGCGFCYNPDGGYEPSYWTDNARHVVVRRYCDGPACSFTHRIFYITFKDEPIIVKHDSINVETNTLFYLGLDKRNAKHEYTLKGKDYLGRLIYVDNYSDPQGAITRISNGEYAGSYRINLKAG